MGYFEVLVDGLLAWYSFYVKNLSWFWKEFIKHFITAVVSLESICNVLLTTELNGQCKSVIWEKVMVMDAGLEKTKTWELWDKGHLLVVEPIQASCHWSPIFK